MRVGDYFSEKKEALIREGNFLEFQFLDINKNEYDNIEGVETSMDCPLDGNTLYLLDVHRTIRIHGRWYLVRFKDLHRQVSKLIDEMYR